MKYHEIQRGLRLSMKVLLTKFVKISKPSRLVYKKLVSKKSKLPASSQQTWFEVNITINWKTAYQPSLQCTKSTKLIVFNFKFLHRRPSTNNLLKKIGLVDSNKMNLLPRRDKNIGVSVMGMPKNSVLLDQCFLMAAIMQSN